MLPFIENHSSDCVNREPAQIPDHLKCGEVYTWQCNGELYAVECALCEDKPLCPLSEFPQHMEVWHTDWEEHNENDSITNEQQDDHLFDDSDNEDDGENFSFSFTTEDSGLYEQDHMDDVEILEPFEQVLIEQDETSINSIQINENDIVDVNEFCLKESKTALLPPLVAKLNGEIVSEQHKQEIINKTTTEKCHNKNKQQQTQNKLSEMNGMEHTEENVRETKQKQQQHSEGFGESKSITDLFTTERLKRNFNKKHTILRDIQKIKENYLGNNALLTEKPVASDLKNNIINSRILEQISIEVKSLPQQIRANLNDAVEKFEENEKTLTRDFGRCSQVNKSRIAIELKESAANLEEYLIEKNAKEYENLLQQTTDLKACSLDDMDVSQKIEQASDLQEALLETESLIQENLQQHIKDLTYQEDNSSENSIRISRYFNDMEDPSQNFKGFKQNIQKPKNLLESTIDYKYISEYLKKSADILKHYTENVNIQQKLIDASHVEESKHTDFEQYFPENNKLVDVIRDTTHNKETLLANENRTHKIEYSTEFYTTELEKRLLEKVNLNQKLNSKSIEESFLENQNLIKELAASNDLAENFGAKERIIPKVIHFTALESSSINIKDNVREEKGCDSSEAKLSSSCISYEKHRQIEKITINCNKNPKTNSCRNKENSLLERTRTSNRKSKEHLNTEGVSKKLRSSMKHRTDSDISVKRKPRCGRKKIYFKRKSKKCLKTKNCLRKNQTKGQFNTETFKGVSKNPNYIRALRSYIQKSSIKLNEETYKNNQIANVNKVFVNSLQVRDNTPRTCSMKRAKQTKVTQFFKTKNIEGATENLDTPPSDKYSLSLESDNGSFDSNSATEIFSPLSPKSEKDHFELCEPKEKLTPHHIRHLIELYKKHPCLWDQSCTDFCEPHLCRKSWQEITQLWNDYCKRNFTIAEVRIRICTLCQRYLQERERLTLEGELDEFAKFPYYEQMQFLEQQKSLQKRKDLYDQQNEKIVEIYEHFPVLWHISSYKLRQAKERANAFQSISETLKLCGIHLSAVEVQKRIRSVKKCYRLEKIRYLHAQVEQTPFESSFKHFEKMQFLDKHIDPFVCRICGKIFENLTGFREHLEKENHGSILQEDYETESESEIEQHNEITDINSNRSLKDNNSFQFSIENDKPIIQEVLIFPANDSQATIFKNITTDDQIIEQLIDNVSNTESFDTQTLENFIGTVSSCQGVTTNSTYASPSTLATLNNDLNIPEVSLNSDKETKPDLSATELIQQLDVSPDTTDSLMVKVQCADFTLDLKLNAQQETSNESDNVLRTLMDTCSVSLPDYEIRKMIELYRKYPQLWNPNHLDFNSRNLRRQAWYILTAEFCEAVGKELSWRTLHRKLTDYAKYYKKLIMEHDNYEKVAIKWTFYEDFRFLDDVIAVHDELQRSVHHRDNNFKIIAIYETLPQLWNIKHPDFNKRCVKQRNIELLCNRLQEENNFQITSERLKNRLIELRAQYRAAKKQRLKCEKNQQKFFTDFEFYEALKFLDDHIDPYTCAACKIEFKKLTDYNHHQKRQHGIKKLQSNNLLSALQSFEAEQDDSLENVCHICGIKFTTRSNLVHHVKRHEGIRNHACTMCPKKFFASHSLKVHIRSHTKECPYTCEKCGMSFVSASKLNQHVKRHSNKKDFTCNYCPKAFYTAFERDRHIRRHLNIRDKACPICGKTFVAGSSYYAHMMLHNDTKRFKCDKCDMKFAQYAGLYKHKKRHHTGVEE